MTAIIPKFADKFVFGHIEKPETILSRSVMIVDEADQCLEEILTF